MSNSRCSRTTQAICCSSGRDSVTRSADPLQRKGSPGDVAFRGNVTTIVQRILHQVQSLRHSADLLRGLYHDLHVEAVDSLLHLHRNHMSGQWSGSSLAAHLGGIKGLGGIISGVVVPVTFTALFVSSWCIQEGRGTAAAPYSSPSSQCSSSLRCCFSNSYYLKCVLRGPR